MFDVKTFIHTIELVLVVPWDQSSLSVGLPRVWKWYTSMTGDQTIPSLVRHQPIHSPEKGLYLSVRHEDPKIKTPFIGAETWVAYFGNHCLLCTLMAVIIYPWPYYLHCDIDPQCKVLVAMLLVVYLDYMDPQCIGRRPCFIYLEHGNARLEKTHL